MQPGRRLFCAGVFLLPPIAGCASYRIEGVAGWQGAEYPFGSGVAFFDAAERSATIGFLRESPTAAQVADMRQHRSVVRVLGSGKSPFVQLTLVCRRPGKASYANLERYVVVFGRMPDAPVTFDRQSHDWLSDGGIELAGGFGAGAELAGRLVRKGSITVGGEERRYRWDLSFDVRLAG